MCLQPPQPRSIEPLQIGFRPTGGLLDAEVVVSLLRPHCEQPLSTLARRILRREVVLVHWRAQFLLPSFQFDLRDLTVHGPVRAVIDTLSPALDDWELASWFAQENEWLRWRRPADLAGIDPQAVLDAARAERFVAIGH